MKEKIKLKDLKMNFGLNIKAYIEIFFSIIYYMLLIKANVNANYLCIILFVGSFFGKNPLPGLGVKQPNISSYDRLTKITHKKKIKLLQFPWLYWQFKPALPFSWLKKVD